MGWAARDRPTRALVGDEITSPWCALAVENEAVRMHLEPVEVTRVIVPEDRNADHLGQLKSSSVPGARCGFD
jgi:hypothetical protein